VEVNSILGTSARSLDWQEAEDLLLQLRIYFVGDGHNVREQLAKYHAMLIPMQCRENADLQDSGFVNDHRSRVALLASQLSVAVCSDRNRSFRSFVETQPGDYIVEEFRKMARAFLEVQANSGEFRLFLDQAYPLMNRRVELLLENVGHGFLTCRSCEGLITVHR